MKAGVFTRVFSPLVMFVLFSEAGNSVPSTGTEKNHVTETVEYDYNLIM